MWTVTELLDHVPHAVVTGRTNVAIRRVIGDSRLAAPEDLFVAVRGSAIDGHEMIAEAIARGATVVVGDRPRDHVHVGDVDQDDVTYIQVENSRRAHAALLRATHPEIRQALSTMRFIGVTGTNGKTTVATVMEQALASLGESVAFFGTTGYRFGGEERTATHTTPDVDRLYALILDAQRAGVKTVVMEVSSHALDQDRVDGIPFAVAMFTNLTRDHLDYHQTMEAYARAKQRLFTGLSTSAIAILYGDDSWAPFMKRNCPALTTITVGREAGNMIRIVDEEHTQQGAHYMVGTMSINTSLLGAFNVVNTALCAVALQHLGWSTHDVARALSMARGAVGRMQRVELPNNSFAVVDYAHTPDALEQALHTLRPYVKRSGGHLHVVFGCGGDRDRGKRPEMGSIAAAGADVVWVTSDNPRTEDPAAIVEDIVAGIPLQIAESAMVHVILDRADAIRQSVQAACAHAGDVVLVAGKGHEQYQVIGAERIAFSDHDTIVDSIP